MTRRMPTLLYALAEAGSIVLMALAIGRAGHAEWATVRDLLAYAALFVPLVALMLLVEEWILARLESRRARSPWAVLAGTVELAPRVGVARYLASALARTLVILALGWTIGLYRPPSGGRLAPDVLALLYAFALVQELIDRVSPLTVALQLRFARNRTCARR